METTLFSRIINREIPSTIEYEDDRVIAIRDIAPSAPVHLLIIPKKVIPSINNLEAEDSELVGHMFLVARDLAKKFGVSEKGYRLTINTLDDGGQTIPHLHIHLLGGAALGRMNSNVAKQSSKAKGTLREILILLLCSAGLAFGFNLMNTKAIAWVKPVYNHQQAKGSDIDKYLTGEPVASTPATVPTPAPTVTTIPTKVVSPTVPTVPTVKPELLNTQQPIEKPAVKNDFVAEPGVIREITLEQFRRFLVAAPYYLIDARGSDKFAEGHIPHSVNYYGGEVQSKIPDILGNVPRDRVILIYCDGGDCELSHHVADVLKQFAYGPIFIFTGGWAEWKAKK